MKPQNSIFLDLGIPCRAEGIPLPDDNPVTQLQKVITASCGEFDMKSVDPAFKGQGRVYP